MKLAIASFFLLLLNSAFSQDPWVIQPGTVEIGPNGDTFKVSHLLGDSPINAKVTLFEKGCTTELGANEIISVKSQTYFSPTSSPSVSSSPTISASPTTTSSPTFEPKKMLAPDAASGDQFGYSVVLTESTFLVGARGQTVNGVNAGSVYLYSSDFSFVKQIFNPSPASGDAFGYSVAASSSHFVVGAYLDDDKGTNSGSAFIYTIAGDLVTKIFGSDTNADDRFGYAVDIQGSDILVGAYQNESGSLSNVGAAYHFDTSGTQIRKFVGANQADFFGSSVAILGSTFIIGAYGDDTNGSSSGTAYMFSNDGTMIKQIYPDANTSTASFGKMNLAVSSSHIVVGANLEDTKGTNSGAAYVFDSSGNRLFKLLPPETRDTQNFGSCVAVTDEMIVVGAYETSTTGPGGYVYVYDLSGSLLKRLAASDRALGDMFGWTCTALGHTVVVGAMANDDNGTSSGSVYTFDVKQLI